MKEHAYYYLDEIVGEINRETVSTSTLRRSARKKVSVFIIILFIAFYVKLKLP